MRNAILVASGIAFGAVVAFIATRAADSRGEPSGKKLIASHVFLSKNFRVWEIDDAPIDGGDSIWAVVRAKHWSFVVGENPVLHLEAITAQDASEEFVVGGYLHRGDSGAATRVIVQSLDLRDFADTAKDADSPLRLVVQVSNGGVIVYPNARHTIIAGTQFFGESISAIAQDFRTVAELVFTPQ